MRHVDIVGKSFGKLKVLSEFSIAVKYAERLVKEYRVNCICSCGTKLIVRKGSLMNGNTKSCGCLKAETMSFVSRRHHVMPKGEAAFNALYSAYRSGARDRALPWELTKEQFRSITSKNCFYCGSPPGQTVFARSRRDRCKYNGDYSYTGLDRIDSSLGYIIGNVCPCCKKCNRAKLALDVHSFYEWIRAVHANLVKNNFQLPVGIS